MPPTLSAKIAVTHRNTYVDEAYSFVSQPGKIGERRRRLDSILSTREPWDGRLRLFVVNLWQ